MKIAIGFALGFAAASAPVLMLAAWLWAQPWVEIKSYRGATACAEVGDEGGSIWVQCVDRR